MDCLKTVFLMSQFIENCMKLIRKKVPEKLMKRELSASVALYFYNDSTSDTQCYNPTRVSEIAAVSYNDGLLMNTHIVVYPRNPNPGNPSALQN